MNLINELMDFRKSESGVLKLNVMPGNLNLFLNEISEEFSELAVQKKMKFNVTGLEGMQEVWFDGQILEKIVINLIGNSFKYTADEGTISVEVLESLDNFKPSFENELILKNDYRGKKYVYIKVADNGIGISKESISHQPIGEFIRTIRLKKAVHLMTHEDIPLIEVMYQVGIQTQSYFTKAFKKEFGKTPSQFLQALKNK